MTHSKPPPVPTKGIRILVYLLSSAMDMVSGAMLFAVPIRAAMLGASYSLIGALGMAWAIGYGLSTFVVGRFVTPARSGILCVFGCLTQAATQAGLLLTDTAEGMLPLLFICGCMHTLFFVPYQIFYKSVDAGAKHPLASSVGSYTFAWSLGMAFGPLWSGFLMGGSKADFSRGWVLSLLFAITACLIVGGFFMWLKRYAAAGIKLGEEVEEMDAPDFARVGWIVALCGTFSFALIRVIFPAGAVRMNIGENIQGGVIFVMGFVQAFASLVLIWMSGWMYRPRALGVTALLGIGGMACFLVAFNGIVSPGWIVPMFFLGAAFYGVYSGSYYSYCGFHSLAHPSKAGVNISVNEGMCALGNILGSSLGGIMADKWGVGFPFQAAAWLVVVFTAIQLTAHRRRPLARPVTVNGPVGD